MGGLRCCGSAQVITPSPRYYFTRVPENFILNNLGLQAGEPGTANPVWFNESGTAALHGAFGVTHADTPVRVAAENGFRAAWRPTASIRSRDKGAVVNYLLFGLEVLLVVAVIGPVPARCELRIALPE
jgi:hypothetical protein